MRRRSARKVAVGYAGFAGTWIVVSSGLLPLIMGTFSRPMLVELGKGLLFVAVTALVLYQLMRRIAQDEKQRYQLLLAGHPQPMMLIDPTDGRIVDANPAAAAFYGWSLDELRSKRACELSCLAPDASLAALMRANRGEQTRFELRHRLASGQERDVEIFSGPALLNNRDLVYSVIVDISERKRHLEALEARERKFRGLFEHALAAVVILEPVRDPAGTVVDFVVVDANAALGTQIDLSPQDAVGRRWSELQPDGLDSPGFGRMVEVLAGGEPARYDIEAFGRILHVNAYRVDDDRVVAVFADISVSRRNELALRASEARYRDLFENNPHPMWVFDLQSLNVLAVNDAAVQKYGYSRDEFLALTIRDIRPPEDVPRLLEDVSRKSGGIDSVSRWRHLKKDGSLIEVEIATHDLDFEGRPARLALAQDITQQVTAEAALRDSEERLRLALMGANEGWWDWDLENDHLYYSPRWWTLLGYAPNELPSDTGLWRRLACPEDLPHAERVIANTLASGERRYSVECRMVHRDGHLVPVLSSGLVTYGPDGKPVRITGSNADLSVYRQFDEQRRMAQRVFSSAGEGMTITDLDGRIVDVNPAFETITGYRRDEVLGKNPSILQSGRQDRAFYNEMWRTLKDTGQWRGEIWNRRKSGEVYPEWLTVSAVKDDKGKVTHYVGVFSDISSVKAAQEKAEFLQHHDPLTGLPNRILLAERMNRGLARARRNDAPMVAMMIGLDRFDAINEAVGHAVGECLLEGVATRLQRAIREVDTLARFSDDQFVLFAEEALTIDQVDTLARRVLGHLEESFVIADHTLGVSASIGVALYPVDGNSVEELVKHSELAMIESRRAGLGQYRYFSRTLSDAALERLQMENALHGAAGRGELALHYQPQIRLRDRALVGLEALLRWNHPHLGHVPPDRFIPLAEEIGLMPAIGRWVLDEACRQMAQWRNDGLTIPRVAVNLSVQQIDQTEIAEDVRAVLARHGIAASLLELELTESMVMRSPEAARGTLQKLRELGVELALDDFGTGYSSLAYLGRLPLSRLKIDRSFVIGIGHGYSGEAIARSVISLANSLGLETVAEGVETEEQMEFLRRHGCQTAQGYWFARPMAAPALSEWLRAGQASADSALESSTDRA